MNPLNAGTLNRRIKFQRPTTIKDLMGAPRRSWTDVATVWAEISHQITVRYQPIFDDPQQVAQMRALYRSRIFNIHSALNEDEKRVQITLLVSEGLDDG